MVNRLVGIVLFLVLVSTAAEAATTAWAWANMPSSATYTPSATYTYNPTGAPISITRSAVGVYSIRFSNLVPIAGTGGNVQVTPYGAGTSQCRVQNWSSSGSDLIINVRCYTTTGAPTDSMYTVLYTFN
jgi:hypothetical protein